MKILVVEDTMLVQIVTKALLMKHGHSVDIAADGEIAVQMAEKNTYDLILMDIGLGDGLDGFETARCIKQRDGINAATPVIAFTSHNTNEYREKAKEVGMLDFMNKPMTPEKLEMIVNMLGHK